MWPCGIGQALDLSFLTRSSKRTPGSGRGRSSAEQSPSLPSITAGPPPFTCQRPGVCRDLQRAHGSERRLTALNAISLQAGMIIDNGVKTTEASAKDKRPFLSVISAR